MSEHQDLIDRADANLYAEIERLKDELRGPPGFATWKDAAIAERMKVITLRTSLAEVEAESIRRGDMLVEKASKIVDLRRENERLLDLLTRALKEAMDFPAAFREELLNVLAKEKVS